MPFWISGVVLNQLVKLKLETRFIAQFLAAKANFLEMIDFFFLSILPGSTSPYRAPVFDVG